MPHFYANFYLNTIKKYHSIYLPVYSFLCSNLVAYCLCLAKVCATINGKINDASPQIFENLASNRIFPHVYASEILAPESLPSQQIPVLTKTPQSAPFLQMCAFKIWCLGILPPKMITPDFLAVMVDLFNSLISWTTSITKSFLQELVKRISPIAPSVKPGQQTGILFLQHQQQIDDSLFIYLPIRFITLLGVHRILSFSCYLASLANKGNKNDYSLIQFSFATRIFPILQCPDNRLLLSSMLNSPMWKSPKAFMKSSQMPPVEVTIQSIILCSAKNLMIYRTPEETILEVYPRQILHLYFLRNQGYDVSQSSYQLSGSSESLHFIISFTISIADDKFVACSPVVAKDLKSSSQLTP